LSASAIIAAAVSTFGIDRRGRDDLADEPLHGRGDQLRQFLARLVLQCFGAGEQREELVAFGDKGRFGEALAFGEAKRERVVEIGLVEAFLDGLRRIGRWCEGDRAKAVTARHRVGKADRREAGLGSAIRHSRRLRPRS
jgi:hypothetical protein